MGVEEQADRRKAEVRRKRVEIGNVFLVFMGLNGLVFLKSEVGFEVYAADIWGLLVVGEGGDSSFPRM